MTAARLNTEVRDALDFLLDPPRLWAYDASGLALANATTTLITFDSEIYDTDTMHSTSTNTSRCTFTTAGTLRGSLPDHAGRRDRDHTTGLDGPAERGRCVGWRHIAADPTV